MTLLKGAFLIALGFSSGAVISGGVFAFITVLGIIPRLAQKTRTESCAKFYEEVILAGGVFGGLASFFKLRVPVGPVLAVFLSLCAGIFFGALAASLAETLKVIPVFTRRARVQKGMFFFVLALALGKLCGSLLYFAVNGFH